ncbi:MAG: glycosyltransferase family 2 protein [Candidatus Micrarchaeota archaeon]|nr:glycosyltransferase family 2 protein [Candidatus Micrarchaeota archaeon]
MKGFSMGSKPSISIVIPTLNEERNIKTVLRGVRAVIKDYRHEIIVVDGYSTDNTVKYAKELGARIIYDRHGKGMALIKGLNAAKGDITISMDADLSNRPNELKLLIAGIEAGYDVCMGSRFLTGGGSEDMPFHRKVGNKIFVSLVNLRYGSHYTDMCYGYRSFAKGVAQRLSLKEKGFGIETEISMKVQSKRLRVLEVPSFEKLRASGEGKLRSISDGFIILKTILKNM